MNTDDSGARDSYAPGFVLAVPLWRLALLFLLMYLGVRSILDAIRDTWRTRAFASFGVTALIACGGALAMAALVKANARKRGTSPTQPAA